MPVGIFVLGEGRRGVRLRARVFLCIPLYTLSHTPTHTHMANSVLFFAAAAVFSCWWEGGVDTAVFFRILRVASYHHQYWAFWGFSGSVSC